MDTNLHLESEVIHLLDHICKAEGGLITFNCRLKGGYIADAYTESGIRRINIPPKTVIEIKKGLLPDTIYCVEQVCKRYPTDIKHGLLIILENGITLPQGEHPNITILNLQSLKNSISLNKYRSYSSRRENKDNIEKANQVFNKGKNALVLGAGVSKFAGLPLWDRLLKGVFVSMESEYERKLFKAITKQTGFSPIVKAQYLKELSSKNDLYSLIREQLNRYKYSEKNDLHKSLVKMIKTNRVNEVLTFNYDDLLEKALDRNSKTKNGYYSVYDNNQIVTDQMPIYHLHGFIPFDTSRISDRDIKPKSIITEQEYHQLYKQSYHWSNITLLHALNTKTCFFVGLSMSDPNLRRLLEYYADETANGEYQVNKNHYLLLKKEQLSPKATQKQNETHLSVLRKMYAHWNITIIWYDDFDDIPRILNRIAHKKYL